MLIDKNFLEKTVGWGLYTFEEGDRLAVLSERVVAFCASHELG